MTQTGSGAPGHAGGRAGPVRARPGSRGAAPPAVHSPLWRRSRWNPAGAGRRGRRGCDPRLCPHPGAGQPATAKSATRVGAPRLVDLIVKADRTTRWTRSERPSDRSRSGAARSSQARPAPGWAARRRRRSTTRVASPSRAGPLDLAAGKALRRPARAGRSETDTSHRAAVRLNTRIAAAVRASAKSATTVRLSSAISVVLFRRQIAWSPDGLSSSP